MRKAGAFLVCLLLGACSGFPPWSRSRTPTDVPPSAPETPSESQSESDSAPPSLPPGAPPDLKACDRVRSLAEAGEHKPALDALDELRGKNVVCPAPVVEATLRSRAVLTEADELVEAAIALRRAGDLEAARQGLDRALEVYPRYYWAQKLRDDVDELLDAMPDPPTESPVAELRRQADRLRAAGDAPGALALLEEASSLAPDDMELAIETQALRRDVAGTSLDRAKEAEQRGELSEASGFLQRALGAAPSAGELREQIVDFARLLGLELFSGGLFSEARELWALALALDATNETLQSYLSEVDERLESLDRIQSDDG